MVFGNDKMHNGTIADKDPETENRPRRQRLLFDQTDRVPIDPDRIEHPAR